VGHFFQGSAARYSQVAADEIVQLEIVGGPDERGSDVPEGRKRDRVKQWWRGAKARCCMRLAPLLAFITAAILFFGESKTLMAAFDASVKTLVQQLDIAEGLNSSSSWSEEVRGAILQAVRQGFSYTLSQYNLTAINDRL